MDSAAAAGCLLGGGGGGGGGVRGAAGASGAELACGAGCGVGGGRWEARTARLCCSCAHHERWRSCWRRQAWRCRQAQEPLALPSGAVWVVSVAGTQVGDDAAAARDWWQLDKQLALAAVQPAGGDDIAAALAKAAVTLAAPLQLRL